MIHKFSRYLLTLVALFAMTAGAWADETIFEFADPMIGTLTQGTTGISATTVTINSTTVNAIKFGNSYVYADGKYITIAPSSGSFKKGDVVSIAGCISNGNAEVYAKAGIYTADGATQLYETANVVNAQLSTDAPVVETYTLTQDAEKLLIARSTGTTALYITTLKVLRTASAPVAGKVYTSAVNITALQVGDILTEGASITGSGTIVFDNNRVKVNGTLQTEGFCYLYTNDFDSFGAEGVISLSNNSTMSPVDKDNNDGNAWEVTNVHIEANNNYINIQGITYAPAPGIEVTTNAASEGATFTEASFDMPTYDATIDYELVRDMSVSMPITVGDGNDGYRIRIKKDNQTGKFVPAETDVAGMMALIKVHDAIENEDLTFFNMGGAVDCSVNIYAIDAEDKPVGDPIAFPNLVPGRYIAKAVAATGSAYEGETTLSNIFVLFQGYEVIVPAGEYITYYKDEALYIENENAKLYTITEVGTETATATELSVAKANMPILVKNNDTQTQTILLIPTTNEADDVSAASEFIGTLTATTIAASDATTNRYAFNGKQFVWVKNAIAVGANKAWLEVPVSTSNARALTLVFGETTDISGIFGKTGNSDNWYDLNGRKLDKMPTKKGVYLFNGKKVVVK